MNKIVLSVLAIALTVGVVSGTAYALFSDTVQVNGITLATGNADLRVSQNYMGPYSESLSFHGLFEHDKMYPGYGQAGDKCTTFWLENVSTADIALTLSAQLPNGGVTENPVGSWDALKNVVQVGLDDGDPSSPMVWRTLAEWNASPGGFDGQIPHQFVFPGNPKLAKICVKVGDAGNEIANKGLTNVTFDITGTQVTP